MASEYWHHADHFFGISSHSDMAALANVLTLQWINNGNLFHFWLNFLLLRPTLLAPMFDFWV